MTALQRTRSGRPVLRRTDDVIDYWLERAYATSPAGESFDYSSMICRGDSLYHYGMHFELGRIMRDKRGRTRLILLNGDSYSGPGGFGPSTSSRQRQVRDEVARTGFTSLVVPFSALQGAGIDFRSIMPVHVREDRFTNEERSSRVQPHKKLAYMPDPSGATEMHPRWQYNHETHRDETVEVEEAVRVPNPDRTQPFSSGHGWCEDGAERDEDGIWRWTVRRHWLGDSIFRARFSETRTRKATPDELAVAATRRAWEVEHDRLGDIESALWDQVRTLDPSRRSWEPPSRDYGDQFRRLFHAEGFRERAERAREVIDEHRRERPIGNSVVDGRTPITVTRWATYLSSFDYQESNPLYFLCELPYRARPNTVEEAIEALKPPEVVAALARGLNVIRQGDLFAIPTKLTKRQIRRMAGRRTFAKYLRVLGTNHSVTEGIVLKGGAVLGRGVMRHEPERWRPPDHAQQKLGDAWHLLVRNTVPRTR